MTDEIRPRTREERLAFIHGYAEAINAVDKSGMESARAFLRVMAEVDVPSVTAQTSSPPSEPPIQ